MDKKKVVITKSDFEKLRHLLESSDGHWRFDAQHLQALAEELEQAIVVDETNVTSDVVTMNSRVRVRDLNTQREFVYQVVFPRSANADKNQVSVLAPIGTALLGYRAGDTIEWQVPSGTRRLQILAVEYQPEATGAAA